MAMRIVFYFEDGTPRPVVAAKRDMHDAMLIKGDIQKTTGCKIVAHTIEFLTIEELEREIFTVRPMRV